MDRVPKAVGGDRGYSGWGCRANVGTGRWPSSGGGSGNRGPGMRVQGTEFKLPWPSHTPCLHHLSPNCLLALPPPPPASTTFICFPWTEFNYWGHCLKFRVSLDSGDCGNRILFYKTPHKRKGLWNHLVSLCHAFWVVITQYNWMGRHYKCQHW